MTNVKQYLVLVASLLYMTTPVKALPMDEAINIPSLELNYQTNLPAKQFAAIHFLGYEGDLSFGNSKETDTDKNSGVKKCKNAGYNVLGTSCATNNGYFLSGRCPYHSNYYKVCVNCTAYTLSSCPANTNCSQCQNGKFKIDSCQTGYKLEGSTCVYGCDDYPLTSCPANSASCANCPYDGARKKLASCNGGYAVSGNSCTCVPATPPGYQAANNCQYGIESTKKDHCGQTYYKCTAKSLQQICNDAGYNKTSCKKYEVEGSCPQDNSLKNCTATCESRLAADYPTYSINNDGYSSEGIIITKNLSSLSSAKIIKSHLSFNYPECAGKPKPLITMDIQENPGSAAREISSDTLENIDIVVNITPWSEPDYCYDLYPFVNSNMCKQKCSSWDYNSYDCCSYDCREDCSRNNNGSANCYMFNQYMDKYHADPCYSTSSYEGNCNRSSSNSAGLKIGPTTRTTTSYTVDGKSSTKYVGYMTIKNVSIKVNGAVPIGITIGGGAHYESFVTATNFSFYGGTRYSMWIRGHNTYAYGKVVGQLSGSGISTNIICVYDQWNGRFNASLSSGSANRNCSAFPLSW